MNILAYVAFLSLGIIWGSSFIFVKIANEFISADQIAFYRALFGLLIIASYALVTKSFKKSHLKYFKHFIVIAILSTVMHFLFFSRGTALLNSGIAGALSGSIPLFTFLLSAIALKDERTTLLKLAGILCGFIGVVLIANPFAESSSVAGGGADITGILYLLLGSAAVGASFVYTKKYLSPIGISAAALTSYQLGLGLLIMLPVIDFTGINNVWNDTAAAASTVIGMGLLNTGVAYIAYYYIVDKLGAVRASAVTYLPPVVAMLIAVILVGEDISVTDYIACGLIILGMILTRERIKAG